MIQVRSFSNSTYLVSSKVDDSDNASNLAKGSLDMLATSYPLVFRSKSGLTRLNQGSSADRQEGGRSSNAGFWLSVSKYLIIC
jgi:hypothetical protein